MQNELEVFHLWLAPFLLQDIEVRTSARLPGFCRLEFCVPESMPSFSAISCRPRIPSRTFRSGSTPECSPVGRRRNGSSRVPGIRRLGGLLHQDVPPIGGKGAAAVCGSSPDLRSRPPGARTCPGRRPPRKSLGKPLCNPVESLIGKAFRFISPNA